MRIFLSWSGKQSRGLAEALHGWLPRVIQSLRPWLSSEDIDGGARWSAEVAHELQESGFGVLCLTPGNLEAPWIMFEAGALSKVMDSARVCPYLLGTTPSALSGPLAQFQAVSADAEGTMRLLQSVNRAFGSHALSDQQIAESFDVWWPRLESRLGDIRADVGTKAPSKRSVDDILEELLDLARAGERRAQTADQREAERAEWIRSHIGWETEAELADAASNSGDPPLAAGERDFARGERVVHPKFGAGIVLAVKGVGRQQEIAVHFGSVGTKKMMTEFAHLAKEPCRSNGEPGPPQ